jgi:DNA mismatch endonuclease (patch repair protein)
MKKDQQPTRQRDPAVTRRIMSAIPSTNTAPELRLRKALHARGLRYRVHVRDVPGCPDLAVKSRKVAVFVDGDFWHGNPNEWLKRGRTELAEMFPNRTEWWVAKIRRNVERDREVNQLLRSQGWRVVRVWASDVSDDAEGCADLVSSELLLDTKLMAVVPARKSRHSEERR